MGVCDDCDPLSPPHPFAAENTRLRREVARLEEEVEAWRDRLEAACAELEALKEEHREARACYDDLLARLTPEDREWGMERTRREVRS